MALISLFKHWKISDGNVGKCMSFAPYRFTYPNKKHEMPASPPKQAKVVICGGGVMGAAVAYHLAELGWGPNTLLVEQGRCGGGTTWHLSGLVGVFKPSLTQVKLAQSSVQLYKDMEENGLSTGWKMCGSLCLARTHDRMTVFRRMKAQSLFVKNTLFRVISFSKVLTFIGK